MFINKKISPQFQYVVGAPLINLDFVPSAKNSSSLNPFKNLEENEFHINRVTIQNLLTRTFNKLENEKSPYYLVDKWLYGAFKIILNTNSNFINQMHAIINDFYKLHPFNLDEILPNLMNTFFQKHTLQNIIGDSKNGEKWEDIITNSIDGKQKLALNVFGSRLLSHLRLNMIDKIPSQYKNFKDIVGEALKSRIEIMLKLINPDKKIWWPDYELLKKWIDNFDYKQASLIQGQDIYDTFFDEKASTQKTNIIEQDFVENQLKKYFDNNLAPFAKKPMLQTVLHYLFSGLLKTQVISPATSGTKIDAQNLINNLIKNEPPLKNLEIFLPNIINIIQQYGFYLKSNESLSGLVITQNIPNDWLTSINKSTTEFDFRFEFKFISSSVPKSEIAKEYNKFKIPVKEILPIFDQAKNLVNKFKSSIIWNPGFKNSSLWTEKDIVEWISSINNASELLYASHKLKNFSEKYLTSTDWTKFTSANLADIDLSSIISSDYSFVIKPIVKFSEKLNNGQRTRHGNIEIYLELSQIKKNSSPETLPIKSERIIVKDKSEIITMIKFFQELMTKKFPKGLNFDAWSSQKGKSFWLNEFLDSDNNIMKIRNLKDFKENLFKRSNLTIIKKHLQPIIEEINRYREDSGYGGFKIKTWIDKDSFGSVNSKSWAIDLQMSIEDNLLDLSWPSNLSLDYNVTKEILKMKLFGALSNAGFFAKTKGIDYIYLQKILSGTPLHPLEQKTPDINSIVPKNFTFKVKGKKVTMHEILSTLQSFGFIDVKHSKVKWKLESGTENFQRYTIISYTVEYYDFYEMIKSTQTQNVQLILSFTHVSPEKIQQDYDSIINSQSDRKNLLTKIDDLFSVLKIPGENVWRNNVSKLEYDEVIDKVHYLIANFMEGEDIIEELEKIYGGIIPKKIFDKLDDPRYVDVFKEILNQKNSFSNNELKKILENNKLINFLKNQELNQVKKLILNFLKVTNKTKYAYFGSGIGFGVASLLAGGTSLRWMRINAKTKKISTKFKKNKYISIISLGATLASIGASVTLTLIFFITKGGF